MTKLEIYQLQCASKQYSDAAIHVEEAARALSFAAAQAEIASGQDWVIGTDRYRATLSRHSKAAIEASGKATDLKLQSQILTSLANGDEVRGS